MRLPRDIEVETDRLVSAYWIHLHPFLWSLARPPTDKMVKQMESKSAFQEVLDTAGNKLIVDFSATQCRSFKMIKPFFHSLSKKYSKLLFLEVDVDNC